MGPLQGMLDPAVIRSQCDVHGSARRLRTEIVEINTKCACFGDARFLHSDWDVRIWLVRRLVTNRADSKDGEGRDAIRHEALLLQRKLGSRHGLILVAKYEICLDKRPLVRFSCAKGGMRRSSVFSTPAEAFGLKEPRTRPKEFCVQSCWGILQTELPVSGEIRSLLPVSIITLTV